MNRFGLANPARLSVTPVEYGSARGSDLGEDLVAALFALAWLIKGKEKPRRSGASRTGNVTFGVVILRPIRGSRERLQRRRKALERNRNGPDLADGILEFYMSGQPSLEFIEKVTLQNRPRLAGR